MSTALTVIRDKLDELTGEEIHGGTTSSGGASDFTTAVDVSLARYPDDYFKDWYLYTTAGASTLEERKVKSFLSPSGTLTVWEAFSATVATSKTYTLSRFTKAEKLVAINRALVDSYSYFYNRITGVLIGQHTDDSNDQEYLLTSIMGDTFTEIPQQVYIHDCYTGEHDGADDAAILTDSGRDWETSELVGHVVYNKTDGSYGTITANTATTVTATLANGTDDDWDEDDEYIIRKPLMPGRSLNYTVITGDNAKFYADVDDDHLILCVGQSPLTAFTTTDTSTTELDTDEQAEIVALKATANLYKMSVATVDSSDEKRYKEQAYSWEMEYLYRIRRKFMPPLVDKIGIDWDWSV